MNKEDIIDGAMYRLHSTPEHKLETWCKHNLLIARVFDDGSIWFKDTYWSSGIYSGMFEDVGDRIEFVFDLKHSRRVQREEWRKYDECDRTWIPIGGDSEQFFVDDRAEKSYAMLKLALESDIEDLNSTIRVAQIGRDVKRKELDRLLGR